MELLNQQVIESDICKSLMNVLKIHYTSRDNLQRAISYEEFKQSIILFMESIMRNFLNKTKYYDDKYSCTIKNLPSKTRGEYDDSNNQITIDEEVIGSIYYGNIIEMTTLFHELNHFKLKYDILLGKVNKNLVRVIKERLLRELSQDPFHEINSIKNGYTYINDDYYECNYKVYSEEKLAEMGAIHNLIFFFKIAGIHITDLEMKQLNDRISQNSRQYQNYLRDFRYNFNFNDYYLSFEEAFDIMIKYNPEWVMYPGINIEYYCDKEGKIRKRSPDELIELYESEKDRDKKKYIHILFLENENVKFFDKSAFQIPNRIIKLKKKYII